MDLAGEQINLDGITVRNSDATGLRLTSTDTGSISVTDFVATNNKDSGVGAAIEGRGIVVDGGERIVIHNSEMTGGGTENVHVRSGASRGQNVEINDVLVADSVPGNGIRIDGSNGGDDVTIQGTESSKNDDGGIYLGEQDEIESVHLEDLLVADNDDTGIDVSVPRAGSFQLRKSEITGNIDDNGLSSEGYGLRVVGGKQIVVRESEATGSGDENVQIERDTAMGQSVELGDFFAAESASGSGVRIDGSNGDDDVTVENAQSDDNSSYGFDLGGESVRIVDNGANGNGSGALNLRDIDRDEVEIRNSF